MRATYSSEVLFLKNFHLTFRFPFLFRISSFYAALISQYKIAFLQAWFSPNTQSFGLYSEVISSSLYSFLFILRAIP